MSIITYEDFQPIAKAVAGHISRKGGLAIDGGWQYSLDSAWETKTKHISDTLDRFRCFFIIFGDDQIPPLWHGFATGFLEIFDRPFDPGSEPEVHGDPSHPMNDASYLNGVFDLFFTDYEPPDKAIDLYQHLWALQLYYTAIGCHLGRVCRSIPERIDIVMAKATSLAREKIGEKRITIKADQAKEIALLDLENEAIRCYDIYLRLLKDGKLTHDSWEAEIRKISLQIIAPSDIRAISIYSGKNNLKRNIINNIMTQTLKRIRPGKKHTVTGTKERRERMRR